MPPEGVCPTEPHAWPLAPTRVGLGDRPLNIRRMFDRETQSYWTIYILNATPRQEPPYCPHRGNVGECEQWAPCAYQYRIAARAWGPGWPPQGDDVERRSRVCELWEEHPGKLDCVNNNVLALVISENPEIGSPSGHYRVCVAPTERLIGTPAGTCREYDFTDR